MYSRALDRPVFIQSKSTGGGFDGHGKNIQNRTKEQLARSLFYLGKIENIEIALRPKDYYWISVLDGNWGVTQKTPLKYLHMLQWAGYDLLLAADSLVTRDLAINSKNTQGRRLHQLFLFSLRTSTRVQSEIPQDRSSDLQLERASSPGLACSSGGSHC